jgi:hypothetical protein
MSSGLPILKNSVYITAPGTYVINNKFDIYNVDSSVGVVSLLLPNIVGSGFDSEWKNYYVVDIGNSASTNPIEVKGTGDTINGTTSASLDFDNGIMQISAASRSKWIALFNKSGGGVDSNIYDNDGTLTGNRRFFGGAFNLVFADIDGLQIVSNSVNQQVVSGDFEISVQQSFLLQSDLQSVFGSPKTFGFGDQSLTPAFLDASALVQLESTDRGFLLPRMTTAEINAIVSPKKSLLVFDSTTSEFKYYDGTAWKVLGGSGGTNIYTNDGDLIGNRIVNLNTKSLTIQNQIGGNPNFRQILRNGTQTLGWDYSGFSWYTVEVYEQQDFGSNFGGTINLRDKTVYILKGIVETNAILKADAKDVAIIGHDRDLHGIKYTGGDYAIESINSNLNLKNIKVSCDDPASIAILGNNYTAGNYNEGRDKFLTITDCQFRNCHDVFYITGYDLLDVNNTVFIYNQPVTNGLSLFATSKIQFTSCEFIRWFDESSIPLPSNFGVGSMIYIGSVAGLSPVGAVNISGSILHPQQTQNGIQLEAGSLTNFGTIAANTFINVGLTTGNVFLPDPLTNGYSSGQALNYDVKSNQGLLDSTSGCVMTVSSNTTTTSLTQNVPAPIDTGTLALPRAQVRYNVSTGGRCTYTGSKQVYVSIHVTLSYDKQGGGNDDYTFYIYKNGAVLSGSGTEVEAELNGALALVYGTLMSQNDYIEIYVENTQSNDDMTITNLQAVIRE